MDLIFFSIIHENQHSKIFMDPNAWTYSISYRRITIDLKELF
jgi:hypothetical protein